MGGQHFDCYMDEMYSLVANQSKRTIESIVMTYEIRVFFEGAQKEVFSSIFLKAQKYVKYAYV